MNQQLSKAQIQQVESFLLRVKEAGIALVSRTDRSRLRERHLNPSLEALDLLPDSGRLIDVGSGGGFPGIPIAITRPQIHVTLVESNARKVSFLRRVSRETTLKNLEVLNLRVEKLNETHSSAYDIVTVRAVAEIPEIVNWTHRLLKPGGLWLLWKNQNWRDEANLAESGIELTEERQLSDGGVLLQLRPSEQTLGQA